MGLGDLGKDILDGLKAVAAAQAENAKQGVADVGQGLLDKLVLQLKYLGFLIAGGTLLLWGTVLVIAEKSALPVWLVALSIGTLVVAAGTLWRRGQAAPADAPPPPPLSPK